MSNNNIIGERIKELRKQSGETMQKLANAVYVAASTIGNYETNRRIPSPGVIAAIAKHYNVSADYLLGLTDKKAKTPCDLCRYAPPSSSDGKPCCMCPVED